MKNDRVISVCIPCYRTEKHIASVIRSIPEFVDHIIVVDDACPNSSGRIAEALQNPKVTVIYHQNNRGVGGAMVSGYEKALQLGSDIIIKVDGDGQMDTSYLEDLISPLLDNAADYVKANRFRHFEAIKTMPKIRLFGNSFLSFMVKVCSGYWDIMDPTNGYTAIRKETLQNLKLRRLSPRYFFEIDMLINLNIHNAVVMDRPIPAKYGEEQSSLKITKIIFEFPFKMLRGLLKRIFLKYYLYDFNMASVYFLSGIPMILWGIGFGVYRWLLSITYKVTNTTGTVMLSVLPLILGFELILQAISIDINSTPRRRNPDEK